MTQALNPLPKQFSGLPLKALIGAPLKAVTDANAMISRSQTQFILDTCFEKIEDRETFKPIMITFELERSIIDANGELEKEPVKMQFKLPLLTLIPINSLAVETLKVSFEMEVKSTTESRSNSQEKEKSLSNNKINADDDSEIYGYLAKTTKSDSKNQASSVARYEIEMKAGQLPLSKGLTAIIDIFSKNMIPIPAKPKN